MPKSTKDYLDKAKKLILIENNAVGHFGDLIKLKTGVEFHKKVLKYNGLPFNIEELIQEIGEY